jgi:hypothetical protein
VVSRSLGWWCACACAAGACACACAACACAREDGAEEMEERNNRVGSKENKKEEEETKGGKTHKVAPTQPGPLLNGPALLGGRTATASRCSSRVFAISFSSSSSSARLAGGRLIRLCFGLEYRCRRGPGRHAASRSCITPPPPPPPTSCECNERGGGRGRGERWTYGKGGMVLALIAGGRRIGALWPGMLPPPEARLRFFPRLVGCMAHACA